MAKYPKNVFRSSSDAEPILKEKYPNLVKIPVAAFGISYTYYENDSLSNMVAETLYTNRKNDTFVGVDVKLVRYDGEI